MISLLATFAHQAAEPSRAKLCSSSLRAKLRNPRSEPPRQDEFSTVAKHSSCEPLLGYGRTSQAAVGTFAPGCVRHLHVLSKATTKRGSEFKKLRSYQTFGEPNNCPPPPHEVVLCAGASGRATLVNRDRRAAHQGVVSIIAS